MKSIRFEVSTKGYYGISLIKKSGKEINEERKMAVTPNCPKYHTKSGTPRLINQKSTIESTEQRSPNEITDWSCKITSEKDIWSATDTNIFDTLTTLEQPIYFLDGRVLKNIVGEPDFVIADNNIKLLIPCESETKCVLT
ncbi:unnamed protein product [Rhizophagus irregularis]|nr:unnamed protein product [Rhizophagus irregularis]